MADRDLLGNELSADEREIKELHDRLAALAKRQDLAPCAQSNVAFAQAALWQVVNDLNIDWGPPDEMS